MKKLLITAGLALLSTMTYSAKSSTPKDFSTTKVYRTEGSSGATKKVLLAQFKKNLTNKEVGELKKQALNYAGKAIPALIEVMKSENYPDKNRWVATFLVGRIMGKKSGPFIAKFLRHPSWVMRMAALKTLLVLKMDNYGTQFGMALKDSSFIVRKQALENIRKLNITAQAPQVWSMLYDKKNYYLPKDGPNKRTNIIKEVIKTVGDLKFNKAKDPLLSMAQKEKYKDIFPEIDYSLSKILNKKSPQDEKMKKRFWKKVAVSERTL